MAYDGELAERIQQLLEDEPPMSQKKMFAGRLKEHQLSEWLSIGIDFARSLPSK